MLKIPATMVTPHFKSVSLLWIWVWHLRLDSKNGKLEWGLGRTEHGPWHLWEKQESLLQRGLLPLPSMWLLSGDCKQLCILFTGRQIVRGHTACLLTYVNYLSLLFRRLDFPMRFETLLTILNRVHYEPGSPDASDLLTRNLETRTKGDSQSP